MVYKTLVFMFFSLPVCAAIHLNQIGYYPNASKIVTIADTNVKEMQVVSTDNKCIFEIQKTASSGYYSASDENAVSFDFSQFTTPGTYRIAAGSDTSNAFIISDSIYKDPLRTIVKSFYFQRCSFALDETYAGKWYREAGHPDNSLSFLEVPNTSPVTKDVHGGWYDAGDFGKYVVCAGITCGNMLGAYELCPDALGDGSLNIPESDNNKNDLLDEIKYELDWLIRMQDTDGGVFFKVGPTEWPWDIMPVEDETERFIIGKSTTSTLNFAAVLAMAGRIYIDYDSAFADDCRTRAENAWNWAIKNPKVVNPENTEGTGPYADGSDLAYSDEFFWALSELYITTNKDVYKDKLFSQIKSKSITSYAWWQDVNNLGFFSLSVHSEMLPDSIKSLVNGSIISYAEKTVSDIDSCAYLIPMKAGNYYWGSNASIGNMANILVYAYSINKDPSFLTRLIYTTDYIFGRNPTGYSYISGLGSFSPAFPAHRQSSADGIKEPIPGFVVGGANQSTDGADQFLIDIIDIGTAPAKCYVDNKGSWASNEVSINQTSAWIPVLIFLEKHIPDFNLLSNADHHKKGHGRSDFRYNQNVNRVISNDRFSGKNASVSLYGINGKCIAKINMTNGNVIPPGSASGPFFVRVKNGSYSSGQLIHRVK